MFHSYFNISYPCFILTSLFPIFICGLGIWGSAFCILFKRLLKDDKSVDPAEMIRREKEDMGETSISGWRLE